MVVLVEFFTAPVRRWGIDIDWLTYHHPARKEANVMAVIVIAEVHGQTASGYDRMSNVLAGPLRQADSFVLHSAYEANDSWWIVELWQSKVEANSFFASHITTHLPPGVRPKRKIHEHWPLPEGWVTAPPNQEGIMYQGPDGIAVSVSPPMKFITTSDPMFVELAQRRGERRVLPWIPLERLLHEVWKPQLARQGYAFVDAHPEPQVADFWRRKDHGQPELGMIYEPIGSNWTRSDRSPAYVLLSRLALPGIPFSTWDVLAMEVRSSPSAYESARAAWVYALFNSRFDDAWQRSQAIVSQRMTEERQHSTMRPWRTCWPVIVIGWQRSSRPGGQAPVRRKSTPMSSTSVMRAI